MPYFNENDPSALEKIHKFISDLDPLFIGMSLMSHEYESAGKITDYLKNNFPTKQVIWGGMHPTIAPEPCLKFADFVCLGEGENTILEYANALRDGLDPKEIRNLVYFENQQMIKNPLNPYIEDLDQLPFPEHIIKNSYVQERSGDVSKVDKIIFYKYAKYAGKIYDIVTSRGCPFSCTYCCAGFINNMYESKKIRKRSIDNVILELEKVRNDYPSIEAVYFHDENFLCRSKTEIEYFAEHYKKKVGIPFSISAIPRFVNYETTSLFKKGGLTWARIGLQSGSDRVCEEVYKRYSFSKDFLKCLKIMRDLKIGVYCDVILDNPFEKPQETLETIQTLMDAPKPFYLQLYSLKAYYGTELYEKIEEELPSNLSKASKKDYLKYDNNPLNVMARFASVCPKWLMNKLVHSYKKGPDRFSFKLILLLTKVLSTFIFEPITYVRFLHWSQGNSIKKTFKAIPVYFKQMWSRYQLHFTKESK